MIKGDKKVIKGWLFYDWANSVYSLTITTAVFPVYYLAVTNAADGSSQSVEFLGFTFNNVSLYSYALSAAFLIAAIVMPLLSGIADYTGKKLFFMKAFCYTGAAACASMFFFDSADNLAWGLIPFIIAGIGYTGSIVFYNAYLPEIATHDMQDKISARGYAFGYMGSVILLVLNLVTIIFSDTLGIDSSLASRIAFLTVGIWWFGFAQITFARLPANVFGKKPGRHVLLNGYHELRKVFRQLKKYGNLQMFLVSFFFFSMGLQTVMYMATNFATQEIRMADGSLMNQQLLIGVVLVIQLIGIPGAHLFSWLSGKIGNLNAMAVAIVSWIIVILAVYFIYTAIPFFVAAFAVGLVMGGSQALCRSTYSKLLPETQDHASYFSFYDVAEKISIVLGTLAYGLIFDLTGSLRYTIIALQLFFIVGLILLRIAALRTDSAQAARVAPAS